MVKKVKEFWELCYFLENNIKTRKRGQNLKNAPKCE